MQISSPNIIEKTDLNHLKSQKCLHYSYIKGAILMLMFKLSGYPT
jgi:hypothetical protein